jgi:uncharacterized membrane protein
MSVEGWLALVVIHLVFRISAFMSAEPTDEVYANSISFQLLGFCLTALPYWLMFLLALLLAEFATFGRLLKPEMPS